jgi:hypothetical protein
LTDDLLVEFHQLSLHIFAVLLGFVEFVLQFVEGSIVDGTLGFEQFDWFLQEGLLLFDLL